MAYDPHTDRRPVGDQRVRSTVHIAVYVMYLVTSGIAVVFMPPGGYVLAAILVPLSLFALWREFRKP